MGCPFPGMDPHLERPDIWPDFHDSFIAYVRAALQPLLKPKYAALTQDRLYVLEHERPILPDISIVNTSWNDRNESGGVAAVVETETDPSLVLEIQQEEIREPLIHIIEPAGRRVVTAIEVLSPDNKAPSGFDDYRKKKHELIDGGTNFVEIDLLRAGKRTFQLPEHPETAFPGKYVVAVRRIQPARHEFYQWTLQDGLPTIRIPLTAEDRDVALNIQKVFAQCWNTGPYPELLAYEDPPPGEWAEADEAWRKKLFQPNKKKQP